MRANGKTSDPAALPTGYKGIRGQILVALKQATQGVTAKDLSSMIGASLNAIRHHLKELEAESLVARRREQRGLGAPVHLYYLSPAGESVFPSRYKELLTDTLARLEVQAGRSVIVEAMGERFAELSRRLQSELAGATGQERLEMVSRILVDEGYMAEWREADGAVKLTEHNCAIKAVAVQFPEICELEERFLRDVLAADVERQTHMLTGCQACEYNIHFPQAGPDGDTAPLAITRMGEK